MNIGGVSLLQDSTQVENAAISTEKKLLMADATV
jgi:hypothetical protein